MFVLIGNCGVNSLNYHKKAHAKICVMFEPYEMIARVTGASRV